MRDRFNYVDFSGQIVIGEGEKDEAPELYIGEKLGKNDSNLELDIAVDPLECTNSVAKGYPNAMSVIATGPKGSLFHAPDMYANKIAGGPLLKNSIDLDKSVAENLQIAKQKLKKEINELVVMVLDRPRHEKLVNEIRQVGARVRFITDGDIAGAIVTCLPDSVVDLLMGIGATAEAVLASAAVKCLGGEFQCRLAPKDDKQQQRLLNMGITNIDKKLYLEDLTKGQDISFTATGIIDGPFLKGVRYTADYCITHSVVMRVKSRTVRYLETHHHLNN